MSTQASLGKLGIERSRMEEETGENSPNLGSMTFIFAVASASTHPLTFRLLAWWEEQGCWSQIGSNPCLITSLPV
jgi:hypothetical protein